MKQSKRTFTPGPWTVKSSKEMTSLPFECYQVLPLPHFDEERVWNARLIAAAPELLACLESILRTCNCVDSIACIEEKEEVKAIELIKKIKGKL